MTFNDVKKAKKYARIKGIESVMFVVVAFIMLYILWQVAENCDNKIIKAIAGFTGLALPIASLYPLSNFANDAKEQYKILYKNYFLKKSLEPLFNNIDYSINEGISQDALAATKLIKMFKKYQSSDLIIADYKEINFFQSNVKIKKLNQNHDSHIKYVPVFSGSWTIFDIKNLNDTKIAIVENGFEVSALPDIMPMTNEFIDVKTDDDFENKFKIFGPDKDETIRFLTENLKEKIDELSNGTNGKIMVFTFNRKLYVGISDNSISYEVPNPWKKINEKNEFNRVNGNLIRITHIVDEIVDNITKN